ncbi:MAG: hypothetical protein N2V77_02830 [Canidatus Methanoxibalbensis ujae]|nr:hypothetical protein [Candidatus Methanoxibalbensis ujae]
MRIRGKVLRIIPSGGEDAAVVDAIVADEHEYMRVSFFGKHAEFVLDEVGIGDVLNIENAYLPRGTFVRGLRRLKVAHGSRITIEKGAEIRALRSWNPVHMTVLAIARPEKGKVCVAGVDRDGNWLRPQSIYLNEIENHKFRNLCVSRIYVDAWRGRRPRKEDRFLIHSEGTVRELDEHESFEFLEKIADKSVKSAFESGRTLGLIKAKRILGIHEKRLTSSKNDRDRDRNGNKDRDKNKIKDKIKIKIKNKIKNKTPGKTDEKTDEAGEKSHEIYIHITFQDTSGSIYRKWPCRCAEFYKIWNEMREKHRWTYRWRMLRMLRKNIVYLAIGLTYTDYGTENLQFGAYPMIVGVHMLPSHVARSLKHAR